MPSDGEIGDRKAEIMENELSRLNSEFARTGNLSVIIAFKDGLWLDKESGHAQIIFKSGNEKLTFGFSPADEDVDLTATITDGAPGKFGQEEFDPDSLTSEFVFNGPPAAQVKTWQQT